MPSPFPGMDPFIEDQEWADFHCTLNVAISEFLAPKLEPQYVARISHRTSIEQNQTIQRREPYLAIRDLMTMEVVTVIEILSPSNKRDSSDGRNQYLAKRDEILQTRTNLVELDLLRGGPRLPVIEMPPGDYYAIVSRGHRRPRADVFAWTIRQPLPPIWIPLKKGEPEVSLDLQQVFTTVYDRARYQLSIDYEAELRTPLLDPEAKWAVEQIANWRSGKATTI